jgi:addiction module RelB/DinJ family antitoxin
MSTTQTNFRLDTQAKEQFEAIVNRLGMTSSTAYNLFVNATIQRQGLPFDVVLDPLSDPDEMKKVIAELRHRVEEANKPDAKWYSLAEVEKELGIHP